MTSTEIYTIPPAHDTQRAIGNLDHGRIDSYVIDLCRWLREIAYQMAVRNERESALPSVLPKHGQRQRRGQQQPITKFGSTEAVAAPSTANDVRRTRSKTSKGNK